MADVDVIQVETGKPGTIPEDQVFRALSSGKYKLAQQAAASGGAPAAGGFRGAVEGAMSPLRQMWEWSARGLQSPESVMQSTTGATMPQVRAEAADPKTAWLKRMSDYGSLGAAHIMSGLSSPQSIALALATAASGGTGAIPSAAQWFLKNMGRAYLLSAGQTAFEGAKEHDPGKVAMGGVQGALAAPMLHTPLPATMEPNAAARELTSIVHPEKGMGEFQENLAKHMSKITDYIKTKMPEGLENYWDLTKAVRGAGDQIKAYWENNVLGHVVETPAIVGESGEYRMGTSAKSGMIAPVRRAVGDNVVSTNQIPHYGGTTPMNSEWVTGKGSATLSQLYRRLGVVNAELRKAAYGGAPEGSVALRSLLNLPAVSELEAEGAGIREVLYGRVSELTKIPKDHVARMVEDFGELGHMADVMKERGEAVRTAEEAPVLHGEGGVRETVTKGAARGATRSVREQWQDHQIRRIMGAVTGEPYEVAKPGVGAGTTPPAQPDYVSMESAARRARSIKGRWQAQQRHLANLPPEAAAAQAAAATESAKQ
jgi:hypothetical protein